MTTVQDHTCLLSSISDSCAGDTGEVRSKLGLYLFACNDLRSVNIWLVLPSATWKMHPSCRLLGRNFSMNSIDRRMVYTFFRGKKRISKNSYFCLGKANLVLALMSGLTFSKNTSPGIPGIKHSPTSFFIERDTNARWGAIWWSS